MQTQWTVHPHGQLVTLAPNLWTVEGTIRMPPGPLSRRMTVVRLTSGDLAIFSAIALHAAEMAKLEQLGRPALLIVPNPFHKEDASAWKARYPELRVLTPPGARSAVEALIPVDDTADTLGDPSLSFITVPGTDDKESALLVRSAGGTTLVINDLIGNIHDARGIMRPILSLMGFAGRTPQVPRAFVLQVVRDKKAVADQFRAWAANPDLRRIVVSHGTIIDQDPKAVLTRLADRLG